MNKIFLRTISFLLSTAIWMSGIQYAQLVDANVATTIRTSVNTGVPLSVRLFDSDTSNGYMDYNTNLLTLAFSEPVESDGAGEITLTNVKTGKNIPVVYEAGYGSKNITYKLQGGEKFEQGTLYNVSVKDFKSINGSVLASVQTMSFTTSWVPSLETGRLSPINYGEDVSLTANLKMVFAKPVIKGIGYIYIYDAYDNTLFQSVSASSDNVTITQNIVEIKHNPFKPNTVYYVFVDPNAFYDATLTSQSFTGINKIYDWTFRTLNADTSLPIKALSPAIGSRNVEVASRITLTFEKMVTLGSGYLRIFDSADKPFEDVDSKNIIVAADGLSAIVPHKAFEFGASYYISIDDGLFMDKDRTLAYKGFSNRYNWTFSTEKLGLIINGSNLDADKIIVSDKDPIFDINLTAGRSSGQIVIPTGFFANFKDIEDFRLRISGFATTFEVGHDFGDITGIELIAANNKMLRINDIGYRITIEQYTDTAALHKRVSEVYPRAQILAQTPSIKIEAVTLSDLKTIEIITNFEEPFTRSVDITGSSSQELREYYSAFIYDRNANTLGFTPHLRRDNGDTTLVDITAKTNGVFVIVNNETTFADIQGTWSWCEPFVKTATAKGVISGMGNNLYSPQTNETRAQFAQMMANALNLPQASGGTKEYADVQKSAWYYDAVMRLRSAGFLTNFNDLSFHPEQPITREEMAVILSAAVQYTNIFVTQEYVDLSKRYVDYAKINPKYIGDIQTVVKLGIMSGISISEFDPKGVANRAQAATVIVNAMKALGMIDW